MQLKRNQIFDLKFHIILFIIFCVNLNAQQEKQIDVLPLEIGNKWTYYFEGSSSNSFSHSASDSKGNIEYEIASKSEGKDSTVWQIIKTRDIVTNVYGIPNPIYRKDTTTLSLVEITSGNHELYSTEFDAFEIFPFRKSIEDTSKFFRYINNVSDSVSIYLNLKDPSNPPSYYNYKYHFYTENKVGILTLNFIKSSIGYRGTSYYSLLRFRKVTEGPSVGFPKDIFIKTLFGKTQDTSIAIWNNGKQTLNISNVTSSESKISILDFSKSIPPLSEGFVKLRFFSSIEDSVQATIALVSNSVKTDNSFLVTGKAYGEAILNLVPASSLHFGSVINNEEKYLDYIIRNSGNIDLLIDSIKLSGSDFVNKVKSARIIPGAFILDTVYFNPQNTGFYSEELLIYSNITGSPRRIFIYGSSGEEIKFYLNKQKIHFNNTGYGEVSDTTIFLKNTGDEPFYIDLELQSKINGDYNSLFSYEYPEDLDEGLLPPNSTASIKIYFSPFNSLVGNDKLRIRMTSPYLYESKIEYVNLTANLPFALSQNFPNPFNAKTKINFSIAYKTQASLKIYDILGKEVKTTFHEDFDPGDYTREIDLSGNASGIYFYTLSAGDFIKTMKLVYLK